MFARKATTLVRVVIAPFIEAYEGEEYQGASPTIQYYLATVVCYSGGRFGHDLRAGDVTF